MYFDSPKQASKPLNIPVDMMVVISINGLAVLLLGVFPSILLGVLSSPF